MKKKVVVISLGGSLIIPSEIDSIFLEKFKKVIMRNYREYKCVIVCGGGSIARQYIRALRMEGKSVREQARAGIRATRMNARFVMQLFGKEANDTLPTSMRQVKNNLAKNKVVVCGALRYGERETSDSTAARLARLLHTDFINLSNVPGLYTKNPQKNKGAKFISEVSWEEFEKIANKREYKPGQHFVLDQHAAMIIRKNKIKTYLLGRELSNLQKWFDNKKHVGTIICG